ncbi:myogenesis-regulating glycosidase-like isoform X2 [Tubulanus polymorphus]|uniref:myogenesis-regulating glycosidase-like isoform X2 n=1 Tax=Tubulanus polymorphus TaxID=672921 RepID=UPI003DA4F545
MATWIRAGRAVSRPPVRSIDGRVAIPTSNKPLVAIELIPDDRPQFHDSLKDRLLSPFLDSFNHDIVPPPPKKKVEIIKPKEYRLKTLLVFLFVIIVGGVTVVWLQYDRKMYQVEIAMKIVFSEDKRTFKIVDRENDTEDIRLKGKLGVTMPYLGLPKTCSDRDSKLHLSLLWRKYGQLDIKYSGHDISKDISCFRVSWTAVSDEYPLMDCYDLSGHWYGGAIIPNQLWPMDRQNHSLEPYLTGNMFDGEYGSVVERYWLSSKGISLTVDEDVPLSVSFDGDKLCLSAAYRDTPYRGHKPSLNYELCRGKDMLGVHRFTLANMTRFAAHVPAMSLFRYPAWSTWGRFGTNVTQADVVDLAETIKARGFRNSYLVLHDGWENRYGDLKFNAIKFPNATAMVDELRRIGFNLTLWIHPFVNTDSVEFHTGIVNDYYVKTSLDKLPGIVSWWRGKGCVRDFTNPAAAKWFYNSLERIVNENGVRIFRVAGGEIGWLPKKPMFYANLSNPDSFVEKYIALALKWGDQTQVSVGAHTQHLPLLMNIEGKQNNWGSQNGLKTIIPTVLTLGLHGYPYLSLQVGSSAIRNTANDSKVTIPPEELYVRWLGIAVFLPAFEFSTLPWQYNDSVVVIAKKLAKLHEDFVFPIVKRLAEHASVTGDPIIRPMWWTAQHDDRYAQVIDDQFMLGDDVIVAPSVNKGERRRDVYLTAGRWKSPEHAAIYTIKRGAWLRNYPVPLGSVPYFVRK